MPQKHSNPADRASLYRASFEQSLVGIAISDIQTDRIVDVNDAMCAMLEYTREELLERGFACVTHPADIEYSQMLAGQILAGALKEFQFEKRYISKSGRTVWAMVHLRHIASDNGGSGMLMRQSLDITERLASERRLRESEARYRAASEGSLSLFCLLQAVRSEEGQIINFRVIDANERCWRLLNKTREQLVGTLLSDLPHSKPGGFLREFAGVIETGQAIEEEFRIDWPGLAAKWMHHQIIKAGDGVAVSSRDITERKESERSLKQSEEHYRGLADSNLRLLSEVNHRVRNNLATLLAMVSMLGRRHLSTKEFAADLEGKLWSMATVHNIMAGADWEDVSLERLAQRILASMKHTATQPIAIHLSGPPVEVSGRQCLPIAMTLHELFTNSCKYGAHLSPDGRIDVTWNVRAAPGQPANLHVTLHWVERGGPSIDRPIAPSLGLTLVTGFIEHDLAGKARLAFPPSGADHTLEFDIAAKTIEG